MKELIGIALLLVGLSAIVAVFLVGRTIMPPRRLDIARKRFLTPVELEMLNHLERAFPQYRVHAQVSMGALLRAAPGLDRSAMFAARGRFSQKIVDYVLQDRLSGEVVALVELDDRTHSVAKDVLRDELTAAGGYHTIRFPAKLRPDFSSVRGVVADGLAAIEAQA